MSYRYFILTVPYANYTPFNPPSIVWSKGQLERSDTGYLHWQFLVYSSKKVRITAIPRIYGPWHVEPTRSDAAEEYVWKEDTRVEGTQFEIGTRPVNRNQPKDWDIIRTNAKSGNLDSIPADIYIRCYQSLKRIAVDHCQPCAIERIVYCFWGPTGTGKSRRAWEEATLCAYPKDPLSKFWDGYRGQTNVVIDGNYLFIKSNFRISWNCLHQSFAPMVRPLSSAG